jgi:hypothetical protein
MLYVSLDNADTVIDDEITVSAPNHRVDLEALKRPRLGGKEPSDDDYRLRFAHALPADSDGRYGDG